MILNYSHAVSCQITSYHMRGDLFRDGTVHDVVEDLRSDKREENISMCSLIGKTDSVVVVVGGDGGGWWWWCMKSRFRSVVRPHARNVTSVDIYIYIYI